MTFRTSSLLRLFSVFVFKKKYQANFVHKNVLMKETKIVEKLRLIKRAYATGFLLSL